MAWIADEAPSRPGVVSSASIPVMFYDKFSALTHESKNLTAFVHYDGVLVMDEDEPIFYPELRGRHDAPMGPNWQMRSTADVLTEVD